MNALDGRVNVLSHRSLFRRHSVACLTFRLNPPGVTQSMNPTSCSIASDLDAVSLLIRQRSAASRTESANQPLFRPL